MINRSKQDQDQQMAKAVRPQLPRDAHCDGENNFIPGKMPRNPIMVWDFSKHGGTKKSPITNSGKRVV